jgi:Protein of unknown function (DUF3221)
MTLGLTSCSQEPTEKSVSENQISDKKVIEGFVKKTEKGNYLIISDKSLNTDDIINLSTQELIDKYSEVYIFTTNKEEHKSLLIDTTKVKIWYDYIRESNPPKSKILKLEIQ